MDRVGDAGVDRGWPGRVRDRYCQRDRSGPQCGRSASEQGNPVPVSVDADKPASHDLAASNRRVLEQVNGRPALWRSAVPGEQSGPGRRWSHVRALDNRTSVGVARSVDLQRVYRSPTCVPNSHGCGRCAGAVHPGAGIGVKAAVEATTPRKPSSTHQKATVRLSRLPAFSITSQGAAQNARIPKPPCLSWQARKPVTFADPRPAPLAWDGGSRSDPGLDPCLFRESP